MERHDTLLIACGSQESRLQLRSVLQGHYNLLEATNTKQMLLLLEQNLDCIASVVLDISSWDGVDKNIHTDSHAIGMLKQVPVIVVADRDSYQDLTLYFRYGAADVLPLNYDPYAMLRRIETVVQLNLHRKRLDAVVEEQKESLRRFSDSMVDALSAIVEYRDADSGHHILRIRNFTEILLEELMRHCPEYGLTPRLVRIIASASALHDVGKIAIPDAILSKSGELDDYEWSVMQTHSVRGCEMLNYLISTVDEEYLKYAYSICRYHHERWDGKGYPDGLQGEAIPICAQVVGLTDCYDALTSMRPYKDAYSHSRAVNMILSGECGAFSPKLLECFKNVTHNFAALSAEYADGRDPGQTITDLSLPMPSELEPGSNLLEKTRAKYYALVHYMDAFLVEIQLDTGLFQVIYNPYPELARLKGASSLRELTDIVACNIVVPEERELMYNVLDNKIPEFIAKDLRRQSFYFHHRPYADEPGGPFEMTFLRIGGFNRRPSMAILCRKTAPVKARSFTDGSLMFNFTECTYVCKNDSGFTLVRPGKDTVSLGGYTPQEVMDIFGGRLLDMAFPEERAEIRAEFDRQLKDGPMVRTEYRFICKDGSIGWVTNKSRLVIGDDGEEYIQTFLFDITASKTAFDRVNTHHELYKSILSQTETVLFNLNMVTGYIDFSDSWEEVFGYKPSQALFSSQMGGETHVHPDDIVLLKEHIKIMAESSESDKVEIRIATDRGRYLWCRVRGGAKRDANGRLTNIMGSIVNIDSEKQTMQALEDKANRDSLTQLLNRSAAMRSIQNYISQYKSDAHCAMLVLDLDNFKEINDSYGHLFGDAVISQVGRTLKDLFSAQDIIARIGGDEFLVLVSGITDRELLASQCRRLRDMLLHTFSSDALKLQLGCSIGVSLCPEHGDSYFTLFSKADQALYQAKANGKNDYNFYSEDSHYEYLSSPRASTPIDSDRDSTAFSGTNGLAYRIFKIICEAEEIDSAVNQVLSIIGMQTNVSRVYVFENSADGRSCRNTYEWCNEGIAPQIEYLQCVSYETDIPDYQDNFNEDGVFYCHDVRELPKAAYDVVEPQGIKSMLHCAMMQKGEFKGYIGFDECSRYRFWTKEEIQVLTHFSEILSMFLLKHRQWQQKEGMQG